ncbi:P-loop containing nucleoside triphosphate hydrolase protein [Coccomyxa subellipsoidea C-169]|uniref:P-loop containing nucleoside triphosphate hydrolase protein n=1 Tax=Coccomyxa subellipsoidea (strain C-169) TaxID=574566 RepID=I0Z365_COCSC|nr:P-loop containing nucleoside triphosphate hydrolase protein [Coccomyxa subellipsoidea C-169]EIE25084.1 P-loop containing nucleoside triphosphate hydrolase protein [Coccomyxa subellipsoidea C-169]|eukprot:XP_005649628.1 P-loop containing nucleoside triphosphate hydrolase protein [Coccomyxa subellipsoidea C-169]
MTLQWLANVFWWCAQATYRDKKKLADKERKQIEEAARAKVAALQDDDNVFDVAYEQQGGAGEASDVLSATDIKVHNLTIRAKGKVLLEGTTLTITAGRRYGLVGPNGMGKSTLLRMIARRQVPVPETLDVLLVEQEVVGTDEAALEAVVAADVELMALREEEAEIHSRLNAVSLEDNPADGDAPQASTSAANDADNDRLAEIYERLAEMGADSAKSRASKILHGLGFTEAMQRRSTNEFSGGWRMRISLARALYIQPTVLLLDEPTNHLDLRAVLWLEEYLQRWKKTLIVVSHDRDFLNTITTDIIHLHDLKLHYYRGNFAQFEEMYEQKRKEVNKAAEKFEKQLKAAKRSGSKANQDKVVKSAKQTQARKAKAAPAGYADEDTKAAEQPKRWSDYTVHFEFPEPSELPSSSLLQLLDADFKYPGRDDFGLQNLNIGIDMGSRVAIVGPNGAGKTTLMNLLAGDLEPTEGEARRSHALRVGRYAQHFVDALKFDTNPVEYLLSKYPKVREATGQNLYMRQQLGRFGLSGHHHLQPICKLSGGQKARVVFTSISLANPHILLLDEPTNHLDMQSIDALSDALEQFEGGVVVISHDSQLLSRVCDDAERSEVWLVEDGKVQRYDGYFEEYKEELVKEISAEMDED